MRLITSDIIVTTGVCGPLHFRNVGYWVKLVSTSDVLRRRAKSPQPDYLPQVHISALELAQTDKSAHRTSYNEYPLFRKQTRGQTPAGN
jgi:hypothetical protein